MSDHTCAATVGCQRQPTVGLVCAGHFARLGDTLAALEAEATVLSAVPSMQASTGNRSSGLASQRPNARLNVIAMNDRRTVAYEPRLPGPSCHHCWHETCQLIRNWMDAYDSQATDLASVLGTLHGWAAHIRQERGFTTAGPITLASERGTLARHLEWACQQPWIGRMYDAITNLMAALRAANGHRPDKPYSRCPTIVAGQTCNGQVWLHDELQPVWRRLADRCTRNWEQAPGPAVCDTCGAKWATAAEKARLDRMIDDSARELTRPRTDDGRPMLTAEELVERGIVSTVSNVRVQAHRRGKSSVEGHYDPKWFTAKVSA